jgi:excisionase family DNA binding protein
MLRQVNASVQRTVTPNGVSMRQVARLYSVHADAVYAAIRGGELPAVKFGGVLRVPLWALRAPPLLQTEEKI